MAETLEVEDPEKLDWLKADSQGRVTLGPKYASKDIRICVIGARDRKEND